MKYFDKIEPVFYIDKGIINLINDIDIKLRKLEIVDKQKRDYLIKKSKVRSIYSSLSIEANSLSLIDVENISQDKLVFGRKDEVQEVKNAIEVYSNINNYDYKSESDFISAYKAMMKYFSDVEYRNHGEAVQRDGKIIYIAPDSMFVSSLMKSIFEFINNSDLNLLVLSAIFHYYFVWIHPFSDGNGRMARFWVSLMLIAYNRNFEYIPIEEEIYLHQEEYYLSIEQCHINNNANIFIKFILKKINSSLEKVIKNNNYSLNKIQNKIIELITNNKYITQNEIALIIGVNVRTVKRNFTILKEQNIIERIGSDKTGYWKVL